MTKQEILTTIEKEVAELDDTCSYWLTESIRAKKKKDRKRAFEIYQTYVVRICAVKSLQNKINGGK